MILFLLILSCTAANGDEDNFPTYEYVQIFQSIPALFEYLLDVVEQRPEILETDDITVFNRNKDEVTDTREKRSYDAKNNNDNDEIRGDATQSDFENEKGIETADAIANEYGSTDINIESNEFEMNKPLKRVVDKESITPSSTDRDKINTSKNHEEHQMYWGETLIGFNKLFSLDYQPEDVVEQIIRIDELLESHNNKKD